jgi:murein DD-endopeptidase MepM/ murein hydrolase activator NlpD
MPEGTLVRAAPGGVVVRVKEDSNHGGPSMD